jgi:hypothetical protein
MPSRLIVTFTESIEYLLQFDREGPHKTRLLVKELPGLNPGDMPSRLIVTFTESIEYLLQFDIEGPHKTRLLVTRVFTAI